jgi:23S rRNA (cytosine1962-C5)-methyltransferase
MDLILPKQPDWELLTSGNEKKVERFGSMIVERPAPQAIWADEKDTFYRPNAFFHRKQDGTGDWNYSGCVHDSWNIQLFDVRLQLRFTGFGNLGVFPEHSVHWPWFKELLSKHSGRPEILNLFAYTGAASIFSALLGARVTHVDSAKSVNAWAKLNAGASGVDGDIRFIEDDAMKFVKREERRRRKYQGIILDPPTFGRGNKGEVWKIENDFFRLLEVCRNLLSDDALFVLVTAHSPGITPAVLRALLSGFEGAMESGEMLLKGDGPSLPVGAYARIACNSNSASLPRYQTSQQPR